MKLFRATLKNLKFRDKTSTDLDPNATKICKMP